MRDDLGFTTTFSLGVRGDSRPGAACQCMFPAESRIDPPPLGGFFLGSKTTPTREETENDSYDEHSSANRAHLNVSESLVLSEVTYDSLDVDKGSLEDMRLASCDGRRGTNDRSVCRGVPHRTVGNGRIASSLTSDKSRRRGAARTTSAHISPVYLIPAVISSEVHFPIQHNYKLGSVNPLFSSDGKLTATEFE